MNQTIKVKLFAIIKVLLVFGFIFNPWIKFPFTFVVIILAILAITYSETKNLADIGFKLNYSILKVFGYSFLAFIIIEPIFDFIIQPIINKVSGEIADYSMFEAIKGDFKKYFKYLVFIWVSAALGEEILFRGFMFRQFNIVLNDYRYKTSIIILLTSILFCLPHFYMGIAGMFVTFIFGIIFACLYVKTNYNLWINILLHGFVDTFFITLAYFGKLDFYEYSNKYIFGY